MYAGEAMNGLLNGKYNPNLYDLGQTAVPGIGLAIKYHLGHADDFRKLLKSGKKLFMNDDYRMPHPIMWVDWNCKDEFEGMDEYVDKIGILLVDVGTTLFMCTVFRHFALSNMWTPPAASYVIMLGGRTDANFTKWKNLATVMGINSEVVSTHEMANVIALPKISGSTEDLLDYVKLDAACLNIIDTFLRLLVCKNIQTVTHTVDAKLNKKRIKKGKAPYYEYKTLTVMVPRSVKQSVNGNNVAVPLHTVPLHVCEGHFKNYTAERPLFGKCVGKYWWQPQERGNKKNGVIEKEYNVIHT